MLKFGFLFIGYKRVRYYWEIVILYRKIAIISLAVFLYDVSKTVQALTVLFVLLLSGVAQARYEPYTMKHLNNMETQAIFIATFTIYCGLYYLTDDIDEVSRIVLFLLIVIGNFYFITYWIYYLTRAAVDIVINTIPFLRNKYRRDGLPPDIFANDKLIKGAYIDPNDEKMKYSVIQIPSERISYPMDKYDNMHALYLKEIDNEGNPSLSDERNPNNP